MKVTRSKNWEQQPIKSNKKMKIRRKSSIEEEEKGDYASGDHFNKLPTDIITSLFLRCSLKSLSMLRCTSKSWNDFIISPSFLHSHLRQSTENEPQILFMETNTLHQSKSCRLQFVSVDMDGSKEDLYTVTIPDEQLASSTMQDHLGFGYLHSKKEYKVGHFFYTGPSKNTKWCLLLNLQFAKLKCEVLTINKVGGISFNRWKEIADTPSYHPSLPELLVNECMYWKTRCIPHAHTNTILSFDFENEKFQTFSPPSSFGSIYGLALMDLKGMLCLPDARRFRRSSILDLWILKDKLNCTWVKEYSIDLVNFGTKKIKSYFGTWNEEIIFTHFGKVIIYDIKKKCFIGVKRVGLQHYGVYSKSLFSLGSV